MDWRVIPKQGHREFWFWKSKSPRLACKFMNVVSNGSNIMEYLKSSFDLCWSYMYVIFSSVHIGYLLCYYNWLHWLRVLYICTLLSYLSFYFFFSVFVCKCSIWIHAIKLKAAGTNSHLALLASCLFYWFWYRFSLLLYSNVVDFMGKWRWLIDIIV